MTAALGREFLRGMIRMNLTVVTFGRTQKAPARTNNVGQRPAAEKVLAFP
jgi:hypothetical protein